MRSQGFQRLRVADCAPRATPQRQTLCYADGGSQFTIYGVPMAASAITLLHLHERTDAELYTTAGHGLALRGEDLTPVLLGPDKAFLIPPGEVHAGIDIRAIDEFRLVDVRADDPDPDVRLTSELQPVVERIATVAHHVFRDGRDVLRAIAAARAWT